MSVRRWPHEDTHKNTSGRRRQRPQQCSCKGAAKVSSRHGKQGRSKKGLPRGGQEAGPLTSSSRTSRSQNYCSFKPLALRVFVTAAPGHTHTANSGGFPAAPAQLHGEPGSPKCAKTGPPPSPQYTARHVHPSLCTQDGFHSQPLLTSVYFTHRPD